MKPERVTAFLRKTFRWFFNLEPVVLSALLLAVLGLWAFAYLAELAGQTPAGTVDTQILLAFRTPGNLADPIGPPWLADMMRDVTALGSLALLLLFTAAVCGFFWLERKYSMVVFVVVAVSGGWALSTGLKSLFGRPRPAVVPYLVNTTSSSFPSGHAMMAAVVYLTLGIILAAALPRRRLKMYVLTLAIVITILVGVSRVFLGVHYPTDVLAGWAGGLVWALVCWVVARWLQERGTIPEADEPGSDW